MTHFINKSPIIYSMDNNGIIPIKNLSYGSDKYAKKFINCNVIFAGRQKQGKSTLMLNMIKIIDAHKHKFRAVHVYLGTAETGNTDYDRVTPGPYIHSGERAQESLLKIIDDQNKFATIHKAVRDTTILIPLVDRLLNHLNINALNFIRYRLRHLESERGKLLSKYNENMHKEINTFINMRIRKWIRTCIGAFKFSDENDRKLYGMRKEDILLIINIRVNGRILIVIDDMAKNKEVTQKGGFMAVAETRLRHSMITLYISDQGISIPKDLRTNSIRIFMRISAWTRIPKDEQPDDANTLVRNAFSIIQSHTINEHPVFEAVLFDTNDNTIEIIGYPKIDAVFNTMAGDPNLIRILQENSKGDITMERLGKIYDGLHAVQNTPILTHVPSRRGRR
jgi:hypothetical protein